MLVQNNLNYFMAALAATSLDPRDTNTEPPKRKRMAGCVDCMVYFPNLPGGRCLERLFNLDYLTIWKSSLKMLEVFSAPSEAWLRGWLWW